MKKKSLFYWRIFILAVMLSLFLTKVISLDTYLTMMGGILVFVVIPETIKAIKDKDRKENP
ncbi:hypothetical protein CSV63_09070 [Sporosarcina sp. P34]|uniref:hypothetical protein n=1 Tax=Sporosarcina sp. P34 TaxID=2048247 RepID=UPI000C166950|nr:hypothetical protein [Sporosarcina sp. P34]PID15304.1 hypothetical protein CSV63_09070 [Sporosarcina sp. P34]